MANQILASVYQIDGNPIGRAEPQNNYISGSFPTSQILMFEATLPEISYVNTAIQFYNNPLQPNQYQTFYVSETLESLIAAANVGGTTQVEVAVSEIDNNPLSGGDDGGTFPHYSFPAINSYDLEVDPGLYFKGKIYTIASFLGYDNYSAIANAGDYKVYTALLTQSGTSAPVATVLQNTLGGEVVWSYDSTGQYLGTLTGAFPANKTALFFGVQTTNSPDLNYYLLSRVNDNQILLQSFYSGSAVDDLIINNTIEIRVYP